MKNGFAKILLGFFSVFALILAYGIFEASWLQAVHMTVKDRDVPAVFAGKKIVFASDFHCGPFFGRSRMAGTVEKINSFDPDIVILGGDFVDYDAKYMDPCFDEMKKIKSRFGVYGVLGNHDYGVGEELVKREMRKASITVLDNKAEWIEASGQRIRIGGTADFLKDRVDLADTLEGLEEDDFAILASHNPSFAKRITNDKIDLVLSGHTHGGQVTLLGMWAPFFHLRYGQNNRTGYYETEHAKVIVSNGVGITILPIRLFARPQINIITLENE